MIRCAARSMHKKSLSKKTVIVDLEEIKLENKSWMPMDSIDMIKIFSFNLLFIHLSIFKINAKCIFLDNLHMVHSILTFNFFFKTNLLPQVSLVCFDMSLKLLLINAFRIDFFLKFCLSHKTHIKGDSNNGYNFHLVGKKVF